MSRSLVAAIPLIVTVSLLTPAESLAQASDRDVAFGTGHAIALRNNGDVLTWGNNVMCQLGRRAGNRDANPVVMMRNAKQVAAAAEHSLVLTRDGKVYGWGMNAEGALGVGSTYDQCEGPRLVSSLEGRSVVQVAAGYNFTIALTSDGQLYCAGSNAMGQCPVPNRARADVFAAVPIPSDVGQIVAVKAGSFHTLALTKDGKLFAFGRGRDGQLGNGRVVNGAGMVQELTKVVSFSAGMWHSAAVLADGSVWLWGNNSKSQLCDGTTTNRSVPTRLATLASRVARVTAGGHGTIMQTSDGALHACGDNQLGALGVNTPVVLPSPTRVVAPPVTDPVVVAGGNHSAFSPDGCAVSMAGDNTNGVASAADTSAIRAFTPRANLSLCAPGSATPLPDVVHPAPTGGASGCWAPGIEEDAAASPRFAPLRQAMLSAEALVKKNAAFLAPLEPVRMRTSMSAGPLDESGARMHIKVVPERKTDGTRLWTAGCGVIPQIDRVGGAISQISIFFNVDARGQFVSPVGTAPKLTGTVGGYPEYNGWVLITKDGRVPWIPQTLADRLDLEGARREKALDEWRKSRQAQKPMDEAGAQKTYEMLKKTDPAGADKFLATVREQARELERLQRDVYPLTTAALEKRVRDHAAYRASFSPEELRAPAVWGDPGGEGKRRLDARIAQLRALTPEEQSQVDAMTRAGRAAEARTVRQSHMERVAPLMADATAEYDLTNIRPGDADRAIGVKPDPAFPDRRDPNRIQVIAIMFSLDPNTRNTDRRAWQQRVKETFDYAALAALIK